jgi:hypothetical protein
MDSDEEKHDNEEEVKEEELDHVTDGSLGVEDEQIVEHFGLVQNSPEDNQEMDVQVHDKFVEASNMVLQLITMGQGQVHEHYPQILESIKNVSTAVAILISLQQSMLAQNYTLSIPNQVGTCDIGQVLAELQNFMMGITRGIDGSPIVTVDYGDPAETVIDGRQTLLQRIQEHCGNMLTAVMMVQGGQEGIMSAFGYGHRDEACIAIPMPSNDRSKKKSIWKKDSDDCNEAAKEKPSPGKSGHKRKRAKNNEFQTRRFSPRIAKHMYSNKQT